MAGSDVLWYIQLLSIYPPRNPSTLQPTYNHNSARLLEHSVMMKEGRVYQEKDDKRSKLTHEKVAQFCRFLLNRPASF